MAKETKQQQINRLTDELKQNMMIMNFALSDKDKQIASLKRQLSENTNYDNFKRSEIGQFVKQYIEEEITKNLEIYCMNDGVKLSYNDKSIAYSNGETHINYKTCNEK